MSRNKPTAGRKIGRPVAQRKMDRRVRQTRDALGGALIRLMHEEPFEAITVQQVLDCAGVGRSTFYAHYRDKEDLFVSDVEDFFEGAAALLEQRGEVSNRIAPVREFFGHVAEMREFYLRLVASGQVHDVWEMGRGCFARSMARRLAESPPGWAISGARRVAMGHALAGALMSLLSWWIDHGTPGTPEEMDKLFHQMAWSGVNGGVGRTASTAVRLAASKGGDGTKTA